MELVCRWIVWQPQKPRQVHSFVPTSRGMAARTNQGCRNVSFSLDVALLRVEQRSLVVLIAHLVLGLLEPRFLGKRRLFIDLVSMVFCVGSSCVVGILVL
ncbi:unnamed protein product [Cercospora beticola]|nr:unnamed protein product [Cercospora beticola]